jgi:hypothetical protein
MFRFHHCLPRRSYSSRGRRRRLVKAPLTLLRLLLRSFGQQQLCKRLSRSDVQRQIVLVLHHRHCNGSVQSWYGDTQARETSYEHADTLGKFVEGESLLQLSVRDVIDESNDAYAH